MTKAVLYDAITGLIVKTLDVPDMDCLIANVQDGQGYILSDYPDDIENYTVSDGALVRKSQAEIDQQLSEKATLEFRGQRDLLLASSDWTQSPDSPLTDAKKAEWATYRQALRDLPSNTADPANPTWPTKPT